MTVRTTRYVRRRQRRRARLDAIAFVTILAAAIVVLIYIKRPIVTPPRVLPSTASWGSCRQVQDACEAHGTPFKFLWNAPEACTVTFQCGRFIPQGHCSVDQQEGC